MAGSPGSVPSFLRGELPTLLGTAKAILVLRQLQPTASNVSSSEASSSPHFPHFDPTRSPTKQTQLIWRSLPYVKPTLAHQCLRSSPGSTPTKLRFLASPRKGGLDTAVWASASIPRRTSLAAVSSYESLAAVFVHKASSSAAESPPDDCVAQSIRVNLRSLTFHGEGADKARRFAICCRRDYFLACAWGGSSMANG